MDLISVIMPVYNAEKFLAVAIKSVITQTYGNFELICVDDGSTDDSIHVLEKYVKEDHRITILRQTNQYAGVARNYGLDNAKGKYVLFFDSDDILARDALENLYKKAEETKADMVLPMVHDFVDDVSKSRAMTWCQNYAYMPSKAVFSAEDSKETLFQITTGGQAGKFFLREFVEKEMLRFATLPRSEDVCFIYLALAKAKAITTLDKVVLYYRRDPREPSLETRKDRHPMSTFDAYRILKEGLDQAQLYAEFEHTFCYNFLTTFIWSIQGFEQWGSFELALEAFRNESISMYNIPVRDKSFYPDSHVFEVVTSLLDMGENKEQWRQWFSACVEKNKQEQGKNSKADTEQSQCVEHHARPKVSVIIPVYNVEEYLAQCLDTIVGQSLKEIEIICVNDGSPDNSITILNEYASRDARIKVITQENKGLSGARNTGLLHVTGQYVYFMDSDDLLDVDALERLFTTAEKDALDVLFFDAKVMHESDEMREKFSQLGTTYSFERAQEFNGIYSGHELRKLLFGISAYRAPVWIQFIKSELFSQHNLKFYEGITHEDELFTFDLMSVAKRVSHRKWSFFHYRIREGSIMTSPRGRKNFEGALICLLHMLASVDPELVEETGEILNIRQMRWAVASAYKATVGAESQVMEEALDFIVARTLSRTQNNMHPQVDSYGLAGIYKQENEAIKQSATYRIGRVVTLIPRKVRGLLRCYRVHGLKYTLRAVKFSFFK